MTKHPDDDTETGDAGFVQETRRLFDESVARLDAATLSRLNRQRQAVLGTLREGRAAAHRRLWWPAAGVAAAAAVAVVAWQAGGVSPGLPPEPAAADTASDLEILMAGENLEMLEDLEFYRWLAEADDVG